MINAEEPSSASPGTPSADSQEPELWPGLKEVYSHLTLARRRQLRLVLALMLVGALAELATIGAIIPFLSLLAGVAGFGSLVPERVASFLGSNLVIAAAALFVIFVLLSGLLRLQLNWSMQNFVHGLADDLTVAIERRILAQPYAFHVSQNSSRLLSALVKVEVLVFDALLPVMQAAISAFLAVIIVSALVVIEPTAAIVAALALAAIYGVVSVAAGRSLARNSRISARAYDERMQIADEGLGGIRDVIIDGTHEVYLRMFERVSRTLNRARAKTAVIAIAPRYVIETAGFMILTVVAVAVAARDGGLAAAFPVLGAFALGAQRLLPLLQQVYSGVSNARGQIAILSEIVELLRLPQGFDGAAGDYRPLPFADRITLEEMSFTYPARRKPTLEAINLEIHKGSTLAVVGETGSGKSTLADLLMGLLEADSGRILIDGVPLAGDTRRRWRRNIAHVPQAIFLADTTIARNIALGVADEIPDRERVIDAARRARLHEFICSLPDGYETMIGERGIRLSGGQRQRLGIARAIYKQSPVLVLDEATSALDEHTEAAVMSGLFALQAEGRTLIVIAHRTSTIAHCDRVVRLHEGKVVEVGTFDEVIGASGAKLRKPRSARPKGLSGLRS